MLHYIRAFLLSAVFSLAGFAWQTTLAADSNSYQNDSLQAKIQAEFAKYPKGSFALAFQEVGTEDKLLLNAHQLYHAASTMKTPVLAEVFKQIERGKFSLSDSLEVYNTFKSIYDGSDYALDPSNDSEQDLYRRIGTKVTIADLLYRMITQSSNLATNIMIDQVGANKVMKTMHRIGADEMKILRGVEDGKAFAHGMNNMVSAYGLMVLFNEIAQGKMVSKKASEEMVEILLKQHFRGIIPAKLPSTVRVANKTGWITNICHDSGIVYLPDGRKYVLILLSKGLDENTAHEALSTVSEYVYRYMMSK